MRGGTESLSPSWESVSHHSALLSLASLGICHLLPHRGGPDSRGGSSGGSEEEEGAEEGSRAGMCWKVTLNSGKGGGL